MLIDSVLRFKGRAAPCVALTEIDFEAAGAGAARRTFAGAMRATIKLTPVVPAASAKVPLKRLSEG